MFYSSIWFQQMVGPGCSPRAAPESGKLVCAHISIISPQRTGPLGVLVRMRRHSPRPPHAFSLDLCSLSSPFPGPLSGFYWRKSLKGTLGSSRGRIQSLGFSTARYSRLSIKTPKENWRPTRQREKGLYWPLSECKQVWAQGSILFACEEWRLSLEGEERIYSWCAWDFWLVVWGPSELLANVVVNWVGDSSFLTPQWCVELGDKVHGRLHVWIVWERIKGHEARTRTPRLAKTVWNCPR